MKKFFQEFKTFAMRGNVIDMAVGIIIGGAFGKIISSLVADVIMPCIGMLVGGINFSELKITLKQAVITAEQTIPAVTLNYGVLIQVMFDFLIIAFCIFLMIKALNKLSRKKEEAAAEPPPPSDEVKLLTEIRDALKEK
ncbi:MAG: large-conductance mechanosensitive channel protein MscL [Bacteroidales bacterium]|jgi:large conductance mechanosensitive channel|nr:large-conductance mechanosensitive channel protein MscL [Bacteroidales bacterium]